MNNDALTKGFFSVFEKFAALVTAGPVEEKKKSFPWLKAGLGAGVAGLGGYAAYKGVQNYNDGQNWDKAWDRAEATTHIPTGLDQISNTKADHISDAAMNVVAGGDAAGWLSGIKRFGQGLMGAPRTGPNLLTKTLGSTPVNAVAAAAGGYTFASNPLVRSSNSPTPFSTSAMMLANPVAGLFGTLAVNAKLNRVENENQRMQVATDQMGRSGDFLLDNLRKMKRDPVARQQSAREVVSWLNQHKDTLPKWKEISPVVYNLANRAGVLADKVL